MENDFHNENIEFLHSNLLLNAYEYLHEYLNEEVKGYVKNLCFNNKEKKKYYKNELKIRKSNIDKIVDKYYIQYLPDVFIDFINHNVRIENNDNFKTFFNFYLDIPNNISLKKYWETMTAESNETIFLELDKGWYIINEIVGIEYFKHKISEIENLDNNLTFNSKIFSTAKSELFFNYVLNEWIKEKNEPQVYISFLFRQFWEKEKESTDTILNNDYIIHCLIDEFKPYCNTLGLKKQITKIKTYSEIGRKSNKESKLRTYIEKYKKTGGKIE